METVTIDDLIKRVNDADKQYDADKIRRAYDLADKAHEGQMRSSGEKYITHPLSVAMILMDYFMDTDTICAALLHDVVEDTENDVEEIRK